MERESPSFDPFPTFELPGAEVFVWCSSDRTSWAAGFIPLSVMDGGVRLLKIDRQIQSQSPGFENKYLFDFLPIYTFSSPPLLHFNPSSLYLFLTLSNLPSSSTA